MLKLAAPLLAICISIIGGDIGDAIKETKFVVLEHPEYYEIPFELNGKRQQNVFVRKNMYEYRSLKIHEAYSIFYDSKDAPSTELLISAFQKRFAIGGLILENPSSSQPNWRIRYKIDIPQNINPQDLIARLEIIANNADALEFEYENFKGSN